MEKHMSKIGEGGQYDSQVFITRSELEGLGKELQRQQA